VNATHAKALAVAAAILAVPGLSGCGVSFGAQTDQIYTPTDGENSREGTVDVLHALIVSDTPGSGRFIAGLVNGGDEDDTLESVQGAGESAEVTVTISGGETSIPANGSLQLAADDAANVEVSGDPEVVSAGMFVRLTLTFQNGEPATVNVPVLAPGEDYADVQLPEGTTTATPEG
jgi:hypothetical protein